MSQEIRYIFGCSHKDRDILGKAVFEYGLELPAAYCKDCEDFCNICLKTTTTKIKDGLCMCDSCLKRTSDLENTEKHASD